MKKNAFSLAEILIALAMIGVLTATLVPTITKNAPKKEVVMIRAAYSKLENVIEQMLNDIDLYPNDNLGFAGPIAGVNFCDQFKQHMNVIKDETSGATCKFLSSNGTKWQLSTFVFPNAASNIIIYFTPPTSNNSSQINLNALGRISVNTAVAGNAQLIEVLKDRSKIN